VQPPGPRCTSEAAVRTNQMCDYLYRIATWCIGLLFFVIIPASALLGLGGSFGCTSAGLG